MFECALQMLSSSGAGGLITAHFLSLIVLLLSMTYSTYIIFDMSDVYVYCDMCCTYNRRTPLYYAIMLFVVLKSVSLCHFTNSLNSLNCTKVI